MFEIVQNDTLFDFDDKQNYDQVAIKHYSNNSNGKHQIKLDLNISNLNIYDMYNIFVNEEIIDKIMYEKSIYIKLEGYISGISDETFKSLKHLNKLFIQTFSLRKFLHSSCDHRWLMHLNDKGKNNYTIRNASDLKNEEILSFL